LSALSNDPPDKLFTYPRAPDLAGSAHPTKYRAFSDRSSYKPLIESRLHPEWDWYRSDVTALSVKVDDSPVFIPLLEVSKRQARQLCPAKPAAEEK
jgi:hypothetical protein